MLKRIIESIIGMVFIVSGGIKLYDFSNTIQFLISISGLDFEILKISLVVLCFAEIFIGFNLIINTWKKRIIFYSIISMIILFILLNIHFLLKGYANCGCFGTQIISSPLASFLKNIIICAYLLYAKYSINKTNLATQ